MSKVMIQVDEPFNLITPKDGGIDTELTKFTPGVHRVSPEVAAHPWVKQNAKILGEVDEDEPEDEDAEEAEVSSKKRK